MPDVGDLLIGDSIAIANFLNLGDELKPCNSLRVVNGASETRYTWTPSRDGVLTAVNTSAQFILMRTIGLTLGTVNSVAGVLQQDVFYTNSTGYFANLNYKLYRDQPIYFQMAGSGHLTFLYFLETA